MENHWVTQKVRHVGWQKALPMKSLLVGLAEGESLGLADCGTDGGNW
jgi:hypothetical protein